MMTKEEAYRQVSGPPIAESGERKGDGSAFYQYCRREGHWPKAVSGWDPRREAKKFTPYMPLRNVSRAYPPTLLIHGDNDSDVPYEQSKMMAAELERHKVPHTFIGLPGGEHGFGGADPALIADAYKAAEAFIKKGLAPASK
jgi:dipeptidyl aminopeptidase/acylaminoacyl peptidase